MDESVIGYDDLFDGSGSEVIKDAVKNVRALRKEYQQFTESVTGDKLRDLNAEQLHIAASARLLADSAKNLNITNKEQQKTILELADALSKLSAKREENRRTGEGAKGVEDALAGSVNGLTQKLREQIAEYNKLDPEIADHRLKMLQLGKDIQNTRDQTKSLTDATKKSKETFTAAKGSYNELDQETKKLVKDLKNLEDAFGKNSPKAKELQKEIFNNTQKLKDFDSAMNHNFRNVGNYKSALSGIGSSLKQVAVGFLAIVGLNAGVQSAFDQTLKFDSINRTLKLVSGSNYVYGESLKFLRKTAEDLGLEFTDLTKNFSKFYAATSLAGFSAEKSRDIFLSFSKAFANLKLSQDDANSAFLALEQIVSKGKVSAEELRRQLGNVMPGAFEIAAKAAGVTTTQLDKLLKSGKLLSADFLPKFAKEVEKTFGGNGLRVEGLQSAMNRFKNVFNSFFQSEQVSGFFGAIVSSGTAMITAFKDLITPQYEKNVSRLNKATETVGTSENKLAPLLARYDELKAKTKLSADEQAELKKVINEIASVVPGARTAIDEYGNALDINKQKVFEFTDANRKMQGTFKNTVIQDLKKQIDDAIAQANFAKDNLNAGFIKTFKAKNQRGGGGEIVKTPLVNEFNNTYTKEGREQQKNLTDNQDAAIKNIIEIIKQGGDLDKKYLDFIEKSGNISAQKLLEVGKINKQIEDLDAQAFKAFKASDVKKRAEIIADIEVLKKQRQEILEPGSTQSKTVLKNPPDDDPEGKAALEKARKKADDLAKANAKYQIAEAELAFAKGKKGVQDEIDLENKKLDILNKSFVIRAKLYSKDSDDYKSIQAEKLDAEKKNIDAILKIRERDISERTKAALAANQSEFDNSRQGFAAEIDFENQKLAILEKSFAERLVLYQKDSDEYKKVLEDKATAEGENAKRLLKIEKERLQGQEDLRKARLDAEKDERSNTRALNVVTGKITQGQSDSAAHADTVKELNEEIEKKKQQILNAIQGDKDYYEFQKQLVELQKQLANEEAAYKIKKAEEVKERKQALEQSAYDFASTLGAAAFEFNKANIDAELEALQIQKDHELALAGNNAQAKDKIEEKYRKKEADLKRKQAVADKLQALFDIGINTAVGISAALRNPITAPVIIPFIIATALVQAALVLAKPIPKYRGGKKADGRGEVAEINEAGFELIGDASSGKLRIAGEGNRTLTYVGPGDNVYTHDQSKTIIRKMIDRENVSDNDKFIHSLLEGTGVIMKHESQKDDRIIQALTNSMISEEMLSRSFGAAISQLPIEQNIFDEHGYTRAIRRGHSRVTDLNSRNSSITGNG